ncbi:MAG: DUF3341 domain-containing protein [Bryobacteraceae bacterium]|nr:DUF3341 domain-containing protein [Bryobacteraceae bacterium]MDW8380251.1 DUF3341 domain-containing protein [Bryobacterales bacterium]
MPRKPLYGLMAEFSTPEELVQAAHRTHEEGYRKFDAFSPIPIEELHHAMHLKDSPLPKFVITAGILGCLGMFGFLYWISAIDYPLNVGGRPLYSWPSFIPVTYEITVLSAGLTTVASLLLLCGFPMPYHPVFNVPRFKLASRDKFFLCIEAEDPKFDLQRTKEFLASLRPYEVSEVEI